MRVLNGGSCGSFSKSDHSVLPPGLYIPWKATAIGKGAGNAKSFLEQQPPQCVQFALCRGLEKRYAADIELEAGLAEMGNSCATL
eukprot:gene57563-biopygen32376